MSSGNGSVTLFRMPVPGLQGQPIQERLKQAGQLSEQIGSAAQGVTDPPSSAIGKAFSNVLSSIAQDHSMQDVEGSVQDLQGALTASGDILAGGATEILQHARDTETAAANAVHAFDDTALGAPVTDALNALEDLFVEIGRVAGEVSAALPAVPTGAALITAIDSVGTAMRQSAQVVYQAVDMIESGGVPEPGEADEPGIPGPAGPAPSQANRPGPGGA
ncbi:transcriptional regulator phhR [Streptomyces laurentii]|uniref:Transcriptional regulator phhR n=1 Tax=Streptomyces laurentii TaxID=39478 RepID=A0A160NXF5_STRLU|nr:transcriptional regulator phhR [Streptomyces laurentii]